MAIPWRFWRSRDSSGWAGKNSPRLNKRTTSVFNISDSFYTDVTGRAFKRWASENELSSHTQEMLALEDFDSLSTITALTSDMIQDLYLSAEECDRLRGALDRLPHGEAPNEQPLHVTDLLRVASSPVISPRPEANKDVKIQPKIRLCPAQHTALDSHEKQSGIEDCKTLVTDVAGSTREGLEHLLELMVELGIVSEMVRRYILATNCDIQLQERVHIFLMFADKASREELRRLHKERPAPRSTTSRGESNLEYAKSNNKTKRQRESLKGNSENYVSSKTVDENYRSSNSQTQPPILRSGNSKPTVPPKPKVVFFIGSSFEGEDNPLFKEDKVLTRFLQSYGQKGRGSGKFQDASSIVCTEIGLSIVTDFTGSKIQMFDKLGKPSWEIAYRNRKGPWNVVVSPHGWIAATFRGSKRLTVFSQDGKELFSLGRDIFESPAGLAVDQQGRYIVTDCVTNKVYRLSCYEDESIVRKECLNTSVTLSQPRYVTVSPIGDIIVSDTGNNCVKVLTPNGELEFVFGKYGRSEADFRSPYGVCCDHHGNIIVADHYNNRVSMFSSSGVFIRHILSERHGLKRPQCVYIPTDRKLYVTHGRMKANEVLVFQLVDEESSA